MWSVCTEQTQFPSVYCFLKVYYRVEETLEETDNDKLASLTETDIGNKMHSSTISFEGASSSGDKGVGPSKELTETEAL